ncbi:MAG: hypothetical protein GYB65_15760 [Chloroflexi bacterium]|nr:hypothetical protein [Chloroflexota bacterium]
MSENGLVDWLLESKIPSIRYLTMRKMQDRSEDDAEVQQARQQIMTTGPVPDILAQQTDQGNWAGENNYYQPKYRSTHWSMLLLVEFAADPQDEHLQRGADFMLADTAERAIQTHAPDHQDLACFWANVLRYVLYCGYADDPRLANVIKVLTLAAGPRGWGCVHNGQLACAWGAIRALWGLAALPEHLRTPEVNAAIDSGMDFIFGDIYSLTAANYPTDGSVHKHWSRLNFPLFYQADILLALRAAADLGQLDRPGVQAGLQWLVDRRGSNGRWSGASPYRSTTWPGIGGREETRRWISLHAARILQQAGMPIA